MIDIRAAREDPDRTRAALARRDRAYPPLLDRALAADERRRTLLKDVEQRKAERNRRSEDIARCKKAGTDATDLLADLKDLSTRIKHLDDELKQVDGTLIDLLLQLPNLPLAEVPDGDTAANVVVRSWGTPPAFGFEPRPHWELGERLGILDLAAGAKIAGSGFPVLRGAGARLTRALAGLMVELHTREHGYIEIQPPLLVNADTARGTGQLPDKEGTMYVTTDGLYLIPTAEVPVTNLHRDDVIAADRLPLAYTACTPCFRREAGAHGKDTRGLLRVHQFDKVELVRIVKPEESPAELERLLGHAEAVLTRLELPYRVVRLATGDLGFAAAMTYDLEVWAAGVGQWLEVSSASTFTDFQARRANIRYRSTPDAKPDFVHTLNASGVAFARTIVALLENNQEADGTVRIPAALAPFLGTERLGPGA